MKGLEMSSKWIVVVLTTVTLSSLIFASEPEVEVGNDMPPLVMYQKLLRQKRMDHKLAVQTMLKMGEKYEKQHKMVTLLLEKIFKVLAEAKVKVMEKGFVPGDPFPAEEELRDAVAIVAENTAFLGDIALHLPDITHDILDRKNEWILMMKWSVGFCNDTSIFEETDKKLLHLMAQELEIIPKEEDFVNPYKVSDHIESIVESEVDKILKERLKKEEKKKKRKKNKGPRLSGGHSEL